MSVKIITPEELRYILEKRSISDDRQVIESLAKIFNMTLYNDDRHGIYRNFKKFCYVLHRMYNESVEEYLSPCLALSIFKEHKVHIISELNEYCEENNELYTEVGKFYFESDIEIEATYLILQFIIDDIMSLKANITEEELQKINEGEIKWDYKHM